MGKQAYVHICIGIMLGMVFASVLNAIQPRTIIHEVSLTIDKPLEARLDIEPIERRMLE